MPGDATAALLSLEGRSAVVVGGCGGIGSAVAAALLDAGASVACLDRQTEGAPPGARVVACDAGDAEAVTSAVDAVAAESGRLDVVVHSAGITRDGVSWKLTDEDWSEVLRCNLDSAFWLLRAATPHLRATGGGSVALVSSINGERGKFGQVNYAASKAGLLGLGRSAARELGRFGIRVNVVAPGLIRTPMTESLPADAIERAVAETQLGRMGEPEDVARAILYLASDMGRHVTGQVLRVDGGQLIA
ncbi:MAG: SDR family oxidoreductase [Planctomycetota bacterium]|jgi:3-oxoacyl-[acyl-carrier protein] reductase